MNDTLNEQIAAQADTWADLLEGPPLAKQQRTELSDWLRTSPSHVQDFLFARSLRENPRPLAPSLAAEIEALLRNNEHSGIA